MYKNGISDELKEISIKSRTCHYVDDIIEFEDI